MQPWRLNQGARSYAALICAAALMSGALACGAPAERPLTISGSAVGREGDVLRRQLDRFRQLHPAIPVALRSTPDAADQRHQLYVQWLNARADDPDVLQLDVVWTPEFAAAGWIAPLDRFAPAVGDFFAPALEANRWNRALFALPWFVDVGMLYWRTDILARAPSDLADLRQMAMDAQRRGLPYGLVWQGARYEGLVTVFLEYLGAFGGRIIDERSQVVVDSEQAVAALSWMRDAIWTDRFVPEATLTWQEEQTRFAFQNGEAAFMRNWPYAYPILDDDAASAVAGRFAAAPMPASDDGVPTAALGGSVLAINAHSDRPDAAYQLLAFLLEPAQMVERAAVAGQYPPRPSLYESGALASVLAIPPSQALSIISRATPRPVTPVYSQLSEILQVALHRALTRQQEPRPALERAAAAMRALLERVRLGGS